MRRFGQGAMVLCVVGVIGCSGSSDLTTPRPNAAATSLSARAVRQERVTGSATIILTLHDNALERYSLSAIRQSDGSVAGEFEEFSEQDGGQRIHAKVYCFTVTGNSARLAARIDQTNVAFGPVGSYVVWSVIDNGEGAKSQPDETTDIFFGGTQAQADAHCRSGFNLAPYFPSIRGNLQVE
jgi:hypothetical protein